MDRKEGKPKLEVLRGGKFDDTSFVKRVEKILPKVQNTSDVKWLFNVFNCYEDLLRDESLKPEDRNNVENIIAETVRRLADLGYSVADRGDGEEIRKTEEYNV